MQMYRRFICPQSIKCKVKNLHGSKMRVTKVIYHKAKRNEENDCYKSYKYAIESLHIPLSQTGRQHHYQMLNVVQSGCNQSTLTKQDHGHPQLSPFPLHNNIE